ncbi:MAG: CYTH domain-containing protein [Oscillospiraceae bacterium]|jgi:uncharacterized protein YjbK|nr:CYTH domain-containing protein [Oscillospiraceae bacterium]
MIEKELKKLISKEKYEELIDFFEISETIDQTNFYYKDNENVLKNNKINVRIREIEGNCMLQVKFPVKDEKGLSISREYEEKIVNTPQSLEGEKLSKILNLKIKDAYLIGKLRTIRSNCQWDKETLICFDKSLYLDTCDYEIEIEFSGDKPNQDLLDVLSSRKISFEHKTKGKRSRFLSRLATINVE